MRPILTLFTVLLAMMFAGCNNESKTLQFALDQDSLEIPAQGGDVEVRVISNQPWVLTGYTTWCTPSIKSGSGSLEGEIIRFHAEASDYDRGVTYRFSAGSTTIELYVSQKGVPALQTSDSVTHWIMPEGGKLTLNYNTNIDCEVVIPDSAQEWLSLPSRALGKHNVTLDVATNNTGYSREAIVTVRAIDNHNMAIDFTVRQPSSTNIIRYTTTDGKIFEPKADAFNAQITNNIYFDDGAIIEFNAPLTTIGEQAFYISYNNTLKSIILPNDVEKIGLAAFNECYRLEDIVLPESLRTVGDVAFQDCRSLMEITFPEGVTTIGRGVFRKCISLKNVTMPDSVTSLGALCFEECEALESVCLSDNIHTIQDSTFYGCTALRELNIPSKLEVVECYAFCGCTALLDITLFDGLKSLGAYAFMSCHTFTEIDIPEGVTTIGDNCFGDCPKLQRASLPESLTVLGANAFFGCTMLKDINIPNSITELNSGLFQGCESLESVVLPSRLKVVGDYAFAGCTSLTEIDLPATVTHINQSAFAYCYSLEQVSVRSEHLKQIQGNTFAHCPSLMRLELYSIEPPQLPELNIFEGCTDNLAVYVPANSVEIYKSDEAWQTYAEYIRAL